MKVWVMEQCMPYEGSVVIGVYSSEPTEPPRDEDYYYMVSEHEVRP